MLREIEKRKDQGRSTLQKRARSSASWLGKIVEAENGVVRPGVRLATAHRDPTNRQVEALGMSPDVDDDRKRGCRAAGLPSSISNHSFRATGITLHQENGGKLEDAQTLAGHADARTTRLYVRTQRKMAQAKVERVQL